MQNSTLGKFVLLQTVITKLGVIATQVPVCDFYSSSHLEKQKKLIWR